MSRRIFWRGFWRGSLTFFLTLNLVFFNALPISALAQEASLATGDSNSSLGAATEANTNLVSASSTADTILNVSTQNKGETANSASGTALSGANSAANSGNTSLGTGNATSTANIVNFVNTNAVGSEVSVFTLNTGSGEGLDLRGSFASSSSGYVGLASTTLNVTNTNAATTTNKVSLLAGSGLNEASSNSGDTLIVTGNAAAAANVANFLNTNFVGSRFRLITINLVGGLSQDIVFPSKWFLETLIGGVGAETEYLTPPHTKIQNVNRAVIENVLKLGAFSGDNETVSSASGTIKTGPARARANLANLINTNIIGPSSSLYILVNVGGKWGGTIFSLPEGAGWEYKNGKLLIKKNYAGTASGGSGGYLVENLNVSNTNDAFLSNELDITAISGANSASANASSAEIQTGSATALANVFNMVNTNVVGHNMLLALINIAGDWFGDIAFGRPDLWIGETISSLPYEAKPGDSFTVTLTVVNNGDTDATQVRLYDDFNQRYLEAIDFGLGEVDYSGSGVLWHLGTLLPGEARQISYKLKVRTNLPSGEHYFTNRATVTSYEEDANPLDNTELISFLLRGARRFRERFINLPPPNLVLKKTGTATSSLEVPSLQKFNISLINQELGPAYEVEVQDILLDASTSEPVFTHSWKLNELDGLKKALIDYTADFSAKTPVGLYKNVVRASGKDYRGVEIFAPPLESYLLVKGSALVPAATSTLLAEEDSKESVPEIEQEIFPPKAYAEKLPAGPITVVSSVTSQEPQSKFGNMTALALNALKEIWPWLLIALLALILALLVKRNEEEDLN